MSSASSGVAAAQPDWPMVLDEYERVLEQHALALGDADVDHTKIVAFEPPPALGPLPEALRRRAMSLATRTRELIGVAQRLVDEAPAPQAPARPRLRRDPRPAAFDQRV